MLITQSGETADTLAAQREMIAKGSMTIAICNVVGSMVAREAHGTIYTHAGPEIGVASTKAFTAQLTALFLFALHMAQKRGTIAAAESAALVDELSRIPGKIEEVLRQRDGTCRQLAKVFSSASNFLFLGRGIHFPMALEGALKLKEISYIHAEGLPAAEMKHGPIALIDESMPVVFIAPHDAVFDKIVSNIQEVKARSGTTIVITSRDEPALKGLIDHEIRIPETLDMLMPILASVPLQLLAYYIAVKRGAHVDQPRNLAKSVTVE
jgi:glucosamine--fructose-6-phosphate aminotransferase (isomerizing)